MGLYQGGRESLARPNVAEPLTEAFVKLLDPGARKAVARFGDLEPLLSRYLADGRKAWAPVALADEDFLAHLARVVNGEAAVANELPALRGADLFLAAACARGDTKAI